jgi:hypothetical protein
VSFCGKGRLHFAPDKVKVNADFYVDNLLPKLVGDCASLLPNSFMLQQDGAPVGIHLVYPWSGLNSAVQTLLRRINGLQTCQTSIFWTTTSGVLCLKSSKHLHQGQLTKPCSWQCWKQFEKISLKTQLIWLCLRSEKRL